MKELGKLGEATEDKWVSKHQDVRLLKHTELQVYWLCWI